MNIRLMFGLVIVCGMSVTSIFSMQGDDQNSRKRKASEELQDSVEDQLALIRRERQAQYRAYQQAIQEQERKVQEEQEQLQREKQTENIQKLEHEQTQFNALETLILTLTVFIDELEYAENFDILCAQLDTIIETLAQSGLDFAQLKQSSNEVLAAKVIELFICLQEIVIKIEANSIAQKACLKLETINEQLSIICQIVGYQGGIAVELKDMYTEEDEQIAHGDYKQEEQVHTAGDEDLARLLQEAQDLEADTQAARLLQEELDRDNV